MPIPASQIVEVSPRLIANSGQDLEFNGLILTKNAIMPANTLYSFTDSSQVSEYFGEISEEANLANIYFNSYENAYKSPSTLLFYQRAEEDLSAFILGASIDTQEISIANLKKCINASLECEIVGNSILLEGIDLSSANSYSDVAQILENALQYKALDYLDAPSEEEEPEPEPSPELEPEQELDNDLEDVEENEILSTGTNFSLTSVNTENSIVYEALANAKVAYLSYKKAFMMTLSLKGENSIISACSGDLAELLGLGTMATISKGIEAQSQSQIMEQILTKSQNWVNFTTAYMPEKEEVLGFATWANAKNVSYLYLYADDDDKLFQADSIDTIAYELQERNLSSVAGQYKSLEYCAFIMAIGASIDYSRQDGAITTAFKSQSGLAASVENQEMAEALMANKMNFVGEFATRNDNFIFNYPGQMFGSYQWIDVYWNAIWLNNALQLALLEGLASSPRTAYSQKGYAQVRAWMQEPINKALNNNVIEAGISLSESQKVQIHREAGKVISSEIENFGFYIQILDASASQRANRQSPTINLWYTYGGAINKLSLSSTSIV